MDQLERGRGKVGIQLYLGPYQRNGTKCTFSAVAPLSDKAHHHGHKTTVAV